MYLSGVELRDFRNYESARVDLADGLTIIHGSVGAGKTNLLEALYFACVTRSCRTSNERELVRFGARAARVGVTAVDGSTNHSFEVGVEPGRDKLIRVDGAVSGAGTLEQRPLFSVFMPDRLELVKGPAALRRAHLDNLVAAIWPARRVTRVDYGRALAQRNALVSRVRARAAAPSVLAAWNRELAIRAIDLMSDRAEALGALAPRFSERSVELGLAEAAVNYRPCSKASTREELEAELEAAQARDLERGFTTHGPHRDDFRLVAGERDLRRFGSQGQQRVALLALLVSERDLLFEVRSSAPVMLMDDVLSELDRERRSRLLKLLAGSGQALVTTADPAWMQIAEEADAHTLHVADGGVHG